MEQLVSIGQSILDHAPIIVGALLTVLGGLKIIARYTSFTWDDKALAVIEAPLNFVAGLLKKK